MPVVRCPSCSAEVEATYGEPVHCRACGKRGRPPKRPKPERPAPPFAMPNEPGLSQGGHVPSSNIGLAALLVNILLPLAVPVALGVGTIIGGRKETGFLQLGLGIGLFLLMMFAGLLGFFIFPLLLIPFIILGGIGVYVWTIVTGVQIYQESKASTGTAQ